MKKFVFGLSIMFVFGFCLNVFAQPIPDFDGLHARYLML
jgi:hypothetical protein